MLLKQAKTKIATAAAKFLQDALAPWIFARRDQWAALMTGVAVWGVLVIMNQGVGLVVGWRPPSGHMRFASSSEWNDWWPGLTALIVSVYAAFLSRWLRRRAAHGKNPALVLPLSPLDAPVGLHSVWVRGLSNVGEILAWLPLTSSAVILGMILLDFGAGSLFGTLLGWALLSIGAVSVLIGLALCWNVLAHQVGAWNRRNPAPPLGDYVVVIAFLITVLLKIPGDYLYWHAGFNYNRTQQNARLIP